MNFKFLCMFLMVGFMTIDQGDAWRWFKRIVHGVKRFVHRNRHWITPVWKVAKHVFKGDHELLEKMKELRNRDDESFNEFLHDAVQIFDELAPQGTDQFVDMMNDFMRMSDAEIDQVVMEVKKEEDGSSSQLLEALKDALASRFVELE